MTQKTFLEKYPEFKGKEIGETLIYDTDRKSNNICMRRNDVEEILDKHFVRKTDLTETELWIESANWYRKLVLKCYNLDEESFKKSFISKQKVKDVLWMQLKPLSLTHSLMIFL